MSKYKVHVHLEDTEEREFQGLPATNQWTDP